MEVAHVWTNVWNQYYATIAGKNFRYTDFYSENVFLNRFNNIIKQLSLIIIINYN